MQLSQKLCFNSLLIKKCKAQLEKTSSFPSATWEGVQLLNIVFLKQLND